MFNDPRLKSLIPFEQIEQGAISQIAQVLGVKAMEKFVILPDVHQGYDIPIGSVVVINGYVWPGAVGVDINCGMCHITLMKLLNELGLNDTAKRSDFLNELKKVIPTGPAQHAAISGHPTFTNASGDKELATRVTSKKDGQLGTLGSGNHFINIGVNADGIVGITLHSGSRYAGNQIGKYWMRRAKKVGTNFKGLYMLKADSDEGRAYITDMHWAFDYATKNREYMMKAALKLLGLNFKVYAKDMINETHNHAIHLGEDRWLHRKGATPAEKGVLGVIPGNMRDGVFITEGLGNEEYLSSASHGAGRQLSRVAARKSIKTEEVRAELEHDDIVVDIRGDNIDEAPAAYKNVFDVIKAQEGIVVRVLDRFVPKIVHIG